MASLPDTITQSIQQFLKVIRQQQRVEAAYLYGSQVEGKVSEWSDIDIAIISPDFSADLFQEQLNLMRLAARIDDRLEPRPFRPVDFDSSEPLVNEIQRTGIQVA